MFPESSAVSVGCSIAAYRNGAILLYGAKIMTSRKWRRSIVPASMARETQGVSANLSSSLSSIFWVVSMTFCRILAHVILHSSFLEFLF
jgi:hypothetical protein